MSVLAFVMSARACMLTQTDEILHFHVRGCGRGRNCRLHFPPPHAIRGWGCFGIVSFFSRW